MYAIGLMSGTSLDGIDASLCEIHGCGKNTTLKELAFLTLPMPEVLKDRILKACRPETSSVDLICALNFELGEIFARTCFAVLEKAGFPLEKLDFVACHGQTVYHQPFADENHVPGTLQIGEAAVIAYELGVDVIDDFRVMDMAAGGQGAPLVPYTEYLLYARPNKKQVLLNIGGIANVTFLNGMDEDVRAFDTGPGNMMVNHAMRMLYHKPYDEDGKIALSGKVVSSMLQELMSDAYISLDPPKSTGREHFSEAMVGALLEKYRDHPRADLIHTLTRFTTEAVLYHIRKYFGGIDALYVGGGGASNLAMVKFLQEGLPDTKVARLENSEGKEAQAFVILGNETLHLSPANMPSATGAKEKVVLGKVTPGRRKSHVLYRS